MDTLAITDRDGLYGAVRFAKACAAAGIAPVVGVDFAVAPPAGAVHPRRHHRPGRRGVTVRATGCWELAHLHGVFGQAMTETGSEEAALAAVRAVMAAVPAGYGLGDEDGRRPVLVHANGFRQSPYTDVKPAGAAVASAPRKLWHSSQGSAGR